MIELSNISVSEGSVTEPVTTDECKAWMQIDFADNDTLIGTMRKGARQAIEKYTNLALVPKTVVLYATITTGIDTVFLPYGTASSIEVVEIDSEENETDLGEGTDYYTRGNSVRLPVGTYKISYSLSPTVNEDIKEAIKAEVANRYKNRGEIEGLSELATKKAMPYRQIWL